MKRSTALILACIVAITGLFAACSGKNADDKTKKKDQSSSIQTTQGDEYILADEPVTDQDGKAVTDKNGNQVTTVAQYRVATDKKGNKIQVLVDKDGKDVTDKHGDPVTRTTTKSTTKIVTVTDENGKTKTSVVGTSKTTTSEFKTSTSKKPTSAITGGSTTSPDVTTLQPKEDRVPKTSAKGKEVSFSVQDQQTIQNMLEVPALYNANYENSDGVPINIAAHVAIWMAQREGLNTTTYASGTIVLDLFKFFGQTVVNFKTLCNEKKDKNCDIKYNSDNDSFTIRREEASTHKVKITNIQYLGNNNYYKVIGEVTDSDGKKMSNGITKVTAVIQKNKLDSSLGFSLKAIKWTK
ncbi:MAG: hypothetical protein ACI4IN_04990 [Eubacterium sp.]